MAAKVPTEELVACGSTPIALSLPTYIPVGTHQLRSAIACRQCEDNRRSRVCIVRQKTAPSVPARTQVFGYEEDKSGRLVMQQPPDHGHTGMGLDRPGPMEYCPDKLRLMKCSPATGWAKSKAERQTFCSSSSKVGDMPWIS